MRRVLVFCVLLASTQPLLADEEIDPGPAPREAVEKARAYLNQASVGQMIGIAAHTAQLLSHGQPENETEPRAVKDSNGRVVPGKFGLVYDFRWRGLLGDGQTQLAFLCDRQGNIEKVQVLASNGLPWAGANLLLQPLRAKLKDAVNDLQVDAQFRQNLQQRIDNTDAKGLLEIGLRYRVQ